MTVRVLVDGQRQPRPPALALQLRDELPQPEVVLEDDAELGWRAWDAAVARLDGVAGEHESSR